LKNALDHLTIPCFHLKPVGLASHGGNRGTQAVDHLRIVVRGLLGVAIPTQVCTGADDYKDVNGLGYVICSQSIIGRIERFTLELLTFAEHMATVRT
jgi:NAD(P)H-dependent FMN reductase